MVDSFFRGGVGKRGEPSCRMKYYRMGGGEQRGEKGAIFSAVFSEGKGK